MSNLQVLKHGLGRCVFKVYIGICNAEGWGRLKELKVAANNLTGRSQTIHQIGTNDNPCGYMPPSSSKRIPKVSPWKLTLESEADQEMQWRRIWEAFLRILRVHVKSHLGGGGSAQRLHKAIVDAGRHFGVIPQTLMTISMSYQINTCWLKWSIFAQTSLRTC